MTSLARGVEATSAMNTPRWERSTVPVGPFVKTRCDPMVRLPPVFGRNVPPLTTSTLNVSAEKSSTSPSTNNFGGVEVLAVPLGKILTAPPPVVDRPDRPTGIVTSAVISSCDDLRNTPARLEARLRVSVALSSRTALPSATSIAPTANVIPDVCTSTPAGKQTTESAAGADPPQLAASLRFLFEPDPPVQVWVQVAAKAVGAELGVTATVTTVVKNTVRASRTVLHR